MPDAKLKLDNGEIALSGDVTTIGRTTDNAVSFPGDSNVSRYHAEIELRGGDHYLIDLNSSNGTTVNGTPLKGEVRLESGDRLLFGGSSEAEFSYGTSQTAENAASPRSQTISEPSGAASELGYAGNMVQSEAEYAANNAIYSGINNAVRGGAGSSEAVSAGGSVAADAVVATSSNSTILVAGAVCGLAVVCAVAAGAYYAMSGSACSAKAAIIKPESGDTINAPTDIELKIENGECVQRAIFTLDGETIASASSPDFSASIDPKDHPTLADGSDHTLQVVLIDSSGEPVPQASAVMLAFETRAVTKPPPTNVATTTAPLPKITAASQVTLLQVQEMTQRLVKQFSGGFTYNVSNKQFLQEVQKRTGEYAQEGYFARAAAYRDPINVAFVREQNLDAPFAFMLAMSRSKFNAAKQGEEEGLFRMTNVFVADNKYNGQCGTETLSDPAQSCAAKAAAIYMKAIVFGVFEGDLVYGAASFGKSPQDAGVWKATLPANRTDVWNTIKTPAEREQLVRFFAAGIVAENPQKFGLSKDRPLSELYRVTM